MPDSSSTRVVQAVTRVPLFERLDVDGYGMYPGLADNPGLHIEFRSGLTLVLGANGLGKTTLVMLLYRMCTGPYEISGLSNSAALGTRSLEATRLSRRDRQVFASRVTDNAASATATLAFTLGTNRVEVKRSLNSLAVERLALNGDKLQASDDRFQSLVEELTDLPTFGDWILVLRYLVFYFEDRRALVWDPTAQRQILRLLLLTKDVSSRWAEKERHVLELDSRVRNLQNTLNREERVERRTRARIAQGEEVIADLDDASSALAREVAQLEELSELVPQAQADRQRARHRALTVEQDYDTTRRSVERLQLARIAEAFPSRDETAQYLMTRLMSTDVCLTCGNVVPDVAAALIERVNSAQCVVCGSTASDQEDVPVSSRELARRTRQLDKLEEALAAARTARQEAEDHYESVIEEFGQLDAAVAQHRAEISVLLSRLPPEERELHQQSEEVSSLRGRLEQLKTELDDVRGTFEESVRRDMYTIAESRQSVITTFQEYAEGFLFESSRLTWSPSKDRVGQTGPLVDFPAFEFEMAGSDFPTLVRRTGPSQVSESQREFVDLAFRMTLMKVAGETGLGSLVIDAPEASLDAVFSERAANVLARFADPELGNRVIITSNLVDGQLIPRLLAEAEISSPTDERIVDLLAFATPTSAVRELSEQYRLVFENMFVQADRDG